MATQYHGADLQSGRNVQKVIEADSTTDAERTAQNLGIVVTGVEINPTHAIENRQDKARSVPPEEIIWSGTPSHWNNFGKYVVCGLFFWLLLPIFVAAYLFLTIETTKYTLTNQRLRHRRGILTKKIDEIELYRVKDTQLVQPLLGRIVHIGNVKLLTSDKSQPDEVLEGVRDPVEVREILRDLTEAARRRYRVREIDVDID